MIDTAIPEHGRLGSRVPRRGNAFSRGLASLLLRLLGWRYVGEPPNTPKMVIAAAPHTSNMDGLIFLIAATAVGLELNFVAKHTLFKGIGGRVLSWLGGVPVDRTAAGGLVEGIIEQYQVHDKLAVVIAPEGTRSATGRWKTGFHRIARQAGVPIALGFMDYRLRRVGFGPSIVPGDDYAADLEIMLSFYRQITPRFPDRYVLPQPDERADADGDREE